MTSGDIRVESVPDPAGLPGAAHLSPKRRASVVRTLDDFLRAASIRSIVYMGDQACPFSEEFDGNDFCAMHILGWVGDEAAACLRVRFFADFAKVERLAVLPRFRRSPIAFEIVRFALSLIARKGYRRAYGHAREGLEQFWARFGAKVIGDPGSFSFSGHRYTEMVIDLTPSDDAIRIGGSPFVAIRPEGAWDVPGVLEPGSQETRIADRAISVRSGDDGPSSARDVSIRSDDAWSTNAQVAWLRWAGSELRSGGAQQV